MDVGVDEGQVQKRKQRRKRKDRYQANEDDQFKPFHFPRHYLFIHLVFIYLLIHLLTYCKINRLGSLVVEPDSSEGDHAFDPG